MRFHTSFQPLTQLPGGLEVFTYERISERSCSHITNDGNGPLLPKQRLIYATIKRAADPRPLCVPSVFLACTQYCKGFGITGRCDACRGITDTWDMSAPQLCKHTYEYDYDEVYGHCGHKFSACLWFSIVPSGPPTLANFDNCCPSAISFGCIPGRPILFDKLSSTGRKVGSIF